jgi:2-succinyl-5-enolpyruvyl-6-hydroxy-3-cyclohexene-1-carboxylate synthase
VTPLVCTSGTAAANFHPAVVESSQARVPLLVLTADRPPEIRDSGANQTIDQEKLFGSATRWYRDVAEPEGTDRKLRSLRTTAARALAKATAAPAGPVHLNFPFRKPLEPTPVDGDVPDDLSELAIRGRDGDTPFVRTAAGTPELDEAGLRTLARAVDVERGLIVAGPADVRGIDGESVAALAHATGFPVLAGPLSGVRYGGHVRTTPVIGGYDGFLDERLTSDWPDPEVVVRVGASPTSKPLRTYLARTDAREFVVDPAAGWREAEFVATDLVVADPATLAWRLAQVVGRGSGSDDWRERWVDADETHFETFRESPSFCEGRLLAAVVEETPDPATLFVSNSMPVRDLDRFGAPSTKSLTVLGNRGASGIDGVVSTALGAASATTDPLTLVVGDIAYYHDMNGLLALGRCDVDATVVIVNNDGGGIFHMLPIADFEPPFTEQFVTPHGLDFAATEALYDLSFTRVPETEFRETYAASVASEGTQVIEVETDAEASHRVRERLKERVIDRLR